MSYNRRAATYDIEYREERDFGFFAALPDCRDADILEVPCGSGRLSPVLIARARHLAVVDLEPEMVRRTREKIAALGFADRLSASVGDMRKLDLGRRFDLAVVEREALQLLDPMGAAEALAAIAAHLRPGGRLIVDLATFIAGPPGTPDPEYFDAARQDGVWETDWVRPIDERHSLTRRSLQHRRNGCIEFELRYMMQRDGATVDSWKSDMRLHRLDPAWIQSNIPANMVLTDILGHYDGRPFDERSTRMIVSYRRRDPE